MNISLNFYLTSVCTRGETPPMNITASHPIIPFTISHHPAMLGLVCYDQSLFPDLLAQLHTYTLSPSLLHISTLSPSSFSAQVLFHYFLSLPRPHHPSPYSIKLSTLKPVTLHPPFPPQPSPPSTHYYRNSLGWSACHTEHCLHATHTD